MNRIRVACVQLRSSNTVKASLDHAVPLIRTAAVGADLIATPEMTSLIERESSKARAEVRTEDRDVALAVFRDLAAELRVQLLIGSLPIDTGEGRLANRSFLIAPDGAVVARYDKIHMFDVDLGGGEAYRESATYRPGEEAVVVRAGDAALGLTICYDLRFPHLYRALAQAGAEIICVPAAFTRTTGEAHWHVLLRARAIETGCFILAPAQGGRHDDGRETYGHSLIISPWGEVIAEAGRDPGVVSATLDLDEVRKARAKIPAFRSDVSFRPPSTP
ncbi:carbon-nitrogen hydrolase family protein [bacterium]|nr:carbon-nitrogen hydrolase family protein [bacterium]